MLEDRLPTVLLCAVELHELDQRLGVVHLSLPAAITVQERTCRTGRKGMIMKEKARDLVENFRAFVEEHRDELEAIQILYSSPYRGGLRYGQVKELAAALRHPPLFLQDHPEAVLWTAYEVLEPEKVKGEGGKALVDLVALVRHAISPEEPLLPVRVEVEERYQGWLREQQSAGVSFTDEHRRWLDAIKDHIASALAIEEADFEEVPFNQMGGLGQAYRAFGDRLSPLLSELNGALGTR